MKSIEEKEAKLRPHWYNSLDLPNWQKEHPAMSWDFPKDPLPIISSLSKFHTLYLYCLLLEKFRLHYFY